MEDNPNPTPTPAPEPATPAPEPAPQPEPTPELTPEPTGEQPQSAETPAPEAPEAPETAEPAPEPEPTPTSEPTPAPVSEVPEPAVAPEAPVINPFNPAAPVDDAATIPVANPADPNGKPKKKLSKGVLAAIIVGAVVLLGGLGFLLFTMLGKNPTDLANTAFQNIFTEKTLSYKMTAEGTSAEQTMTYSTEMIALENGEAYFRIEGLGQLFGALFSAFGSSSALSSDSLDAAFKQVEATWWKIEPGEEASDVSMLNIDASGLSLEKRQKIAAALKANPFLIAEKVAQKGYSTSGDTYKITIDKDKLTAYKNALGDNENDSAISGLNFDSESETPLYITMTTPLFGAPVLTGIYSETTTESSTGKISIDFEHSQKTAPAEFKKISEMATMLQEAFSGITPSADDDENGATSIDSATRDTTRRNDYAALAANITSYMTNNNGQLPAVGILDATKYVNATGTDPSGHPYHLEVVDYAEEYEMGWGVNEGEDTNVYVVLHATCDADYKLAETDSARAFAIAGSLESDTYYCLASM